MFTLFDPGVNGIKAELTDIIPLAVKYGIKAVSVPVYLLQDPALAEKATELLRENGMCWGMLPTPADFYSEALSDEAFDNALIEFGKWAGLAGKMGIRFCYNHIWSGSDLRAEDDQADWVLKRLRRVWHIADDNGVRYGMEFLGPRPLQKMFRFPFYDRIGQILALSDSVNPRCGFLFDTYHWYCGSDMDANDLESAVKNVHRMVGFHVNDGVPGRTREQQEDMERRLPLTTGIIDAALPYKRFHDAGYDGPILCEPMFPWLGNKEGRSLEETIRTVADSYERVRLTALTR